MRILIALFLISPTLLFAQETQIGGSRADRQKERLQAVGRAKVQLNAALRVPESKMTLVSATPATWPDASLGCPEKDRMYAQVVTKGWTVLLEAEGKTHTVHVSGRRAVVCPADQKQPGC